MLAKARVALSGCVIQASTVDMQSSHEGGSVY